MDATRVWVISVTDYADRSKTTSYYEKTLDEGLYRLENSVIVGHNFLEYDLQMLMKLHGFEIDYRRVIDTLVMSRLGFPDRIGGHSLAERGFELGFEKVVHEEWDRFSAHMVERCEGDCVLTGMVADLLLPMLALQPLAVATEHTEQYFLGCAKMRGVPGDEAEMKAVASSLMTENEVMTKTLKRLFPPILVPPKPSELSRSISVVNCRHPLYGALDPNVEYCPLVEQEFNPGSRQQIARRLQSRGWKPKEFTNDGQPMTKEDILREIDSELIPEAEALADWLHNDKLIGQIMSEPDKNGHGGGWLHHMRNGRVHPTWIACGTLGGRPSCSSPNLTQVSRDPRMRRCWKAPKGAVFIGIDQSAGELRCLANRLLPYDGGKYIDVFKQGYDIHSHNQEIIGFWNRNPWTKNETYGYIYGAGLDRMGLLARKDAQAAHEEVKWDHLGIERYSPLDVIGKAVRERLESGIHGLKQLKSALIHAAKASGKYPRLTGMDGRTLRVRGMYAILNLILQSDLAVIMKQQLINTVLRLWNEFDCPPERMDFGLSIFPHDELQFILPEKVAYDAQDMLVEEAACAGVLFDFKCPLVGEAKIGYTWEDTH